MSERRLDLGSERGASLVQVAVMLTTMLGTSAFAIDYGMLLVGRSQIQNAADAAALAGAASLAFDINRGDWDYPLAAGSATSLTALNDVAMAPPVLDGGDISYPRCPDSFEDGANQPEHLSCVKVQVFRDEAHGNPLRSFFARFLGFETADVTATAMAQAKRANATQCLKPLAIPDRWQDFFAPAGTFDKYDAMGDLVLPEPDSYLPPNRFGPGTGFMMTTEVGLQVTLSHAAAGSAPEYWRYVPVQIPDSEQPSFQDNVEQCANALVSVGDELPLEPANVEAAVTASMQTIIDADPDAVWNEATQRIEGSCAAAASPCGAISPRVIAVALYDPDLKADANLAGTNTVTVRNVVGFFVESADATSVTGYLMRYPGVIDSNAERLFDYSAFLRTVALVE
jgi:Flp pilus assembly protein TadG